MGLLDARSLAVCGPWSLRAVVNPAGRVCVCWEGCGWRMRLWLHLFRFSVSFFFSFHCTLLSYLFFFVFAFVFVFVLFQWEALPFEGKDVTLSIKAVAPEICPHAFFSIPLFATNSVIFQKSHDHGPPCQDQTGKRLFKMSLSSFPSSCCSPVKSPEHGLGLQGMGTGRGLSRQMSWGAGGENEERAISLMPSPYLCLGSMDLCVWVCLFVFFR